MHPKLISAGKKLERAEAAFAAVVKNVQSKCKHEVVHARPSGNPFQYLDTYWQEARVCKTCGLYEEGKWGTFKKLRTENVVMHDFNFNIYAHRIDGPVTNGDDTDG